jgi:hypothetical protein
MEQESMVTLLLKILHKQRSNDYYDLIEKFSFERTSNVNGITRIGDAYHFIANILQLSSEMNASCRTFIEQEIAKIRIQHQNQQRQPTTTKTTDLTVEQK